MNRSTFNEVFSWLGKYHGKPPDTDIESYWKVFNDADEDLFCRAAMESCREILQGVFPSINDLGSFMLAETERDKKRADMIGNFKKLSPTGLAAIKLLDRLFSNHLTLEDLAIEMMTTMEEKHPRMGWNQYGEALLRHLADGKDDA